MQAPSKLCFAVCGFFLWAVSGCYSDPDSVLGNGMHPNDTLQAKYDTSFHIEAYSVADDSIILQNASWILLGSSNSDVFGTVSYNAAIQLLMVRTNDDDDYSTGKLSASPSVDSVILYLPYSGVSPVHGGMDGRSLGISVYKITEKLSDGAGYDSAYSSNYRTLYDASCPLTKGGNPLIVKPKPFDTVTDSVSGYVITAPLKIPLTEKFGSELLELVRNMPEADWGYMEKFADKFNGIYIKSHGVEPGKDIVFSVSNLFASGAMLRVYHDKNCYQSFILGPVRYTETERQRTGDYKTQTENGDTALGKNLLYVEGSGGSRIRFRLPDFADVLRDSVTGRVKRVVLNQAVLVLTNANKDEEPDITFPEQLSCFQYVHRGKINTLSETGENGYYNKNTGQYRINITRYLQQILYHGTLDSVNYNQFNALLDIAPSSDERYEEPVRAVFYGPGTGGSKAMHIEVIYTVVNE